MKRHDKPKLNVRPTARSVDDFAAAAGETDLTQLPARPPPTDAARDPRGGVDAPGGDGKRRHDVRFILRMSALHHDMLAWLSERSRDGHRRDSMNSIALDLLEPALEAEVERRRGELGV